MVMVILADSPAVFRFIFVKKHNANWVGQSTTVIHITTVSNLTSWPKHDHSGINGDDQRQWTGNKLLLIMNNWTCTIHWICDSFDKYDEYGHWNDQ